MIPVITAIKDEKQADREEDRRDTFEGDPVMIFESVAICSLAGYLAMKLSGISLISGWVSILTTLYSPLAAATIFFRSTAMSP